MMKRVHAFRLLTLADQLAAVDGFGVKSFDMRHWFNTNNAAVDDGEIQSTQQLQECGATACAVGFAMLNPVLQKAGLKNVVGHPKYKQYHHWSAVEAFFGLPSSGSALTPHRDTRHLFGLEHTRTPAEEAEVLRKFVQKRAPKHYKAHYNRVI